MDCSTLDFPVHHQFPELAQTQVHRVGDAIQHLILCRPLLLPPSILPRCSIWGFPGGTVVKNPPANAGDARDAGSVPELRRFSGVGKDNPL